MYAASDVIEYLLSSTGGGAQDSEHRLLRQAVHHAYRDLVTVREWRWYQANETIAISGKEIVHMMPWGVQSVDSIELHQTGLRAEYVDPMNYQRLANSEEYELVSLVWTMVRSMTSPDRYDLRILNGHHYSEDATLTYRRRPRDLRLTGYEPTSRQGVVDWNGFEAFGSGTAFNNHMVGAIIRVSGDSTYHPEGLAGMHSYTDEGLIYQVVNSNKLYAWSPAGGMGYSGTKYIISDYLDMSPSMYTALLSGAEVWAARLMGKNIEGAVGVYGRDLRLAFEGDAVAPIWGRVGGTGHYYDFWYLRPGVDQGGCYCGLGGPDADGVCPIKPDVSGGDADGPWQGNYDGGNAATVFGKCD